MSDKKILSVNDLSVGYEKVPFVENVTFSVDEGRVVAIVGPNGAGKTTLLRGIMGSLPRFGGSSTILGDSSIKASQQAAYVPQHSSIDWDFPATVHQVVMQGRYQSMGLFKRPSKEDESLVISALEKVGMQDFRDRQIGQLSGGQRQRVFLARALAQDKRLYIFDEPFQGVDAATERAIVNVMYTIRDNNGSVVVVHHDLSTVMEYFDDVLLLNRRVVAFGSVDHIYTKENLQTCFGGGLTIIGAIAGSDDDGE